MKFGFGSSKDQYNMHEMGSNRDQSMDGTTSCKAQTPAGTKVTYYMVRIVLGLQIVMAIGTVVGFVLTYSHIQTTPTADNAASLGNAMNLEVKSGNDTAVLRKILEDMEGKIMTETAALIRTNIDGMELNIETHIEVLQTDIAEMEGEILTNSKALLENTNDLESIANEMHGKTISDCSKVSPGDNQTRNLNGDVYEIYVAGHKLNVSCDLSTDSGGWTVIQRRMDGSVDFYRDYADYVKGFGSASGELWIGLDNLYDILQSADNFELKIDMEDWENTTAYASYSHFDIGKPWLDYSLTVSGYSGTAGDSLTRHDGDRFTTKDHDVDQHGEYNCAVTYKGAWWYDNCHKSNLNGFYHNGGFHSSNADGINWYSWKGFHYSLKFVEMKVRPTSR